MDEVRNGLYYFETTLYDLAPEIEAPARARPRAALPRRPVEPHFLRFGSWIGGDRDGNPFVTVAATEQALRAHHELALRLLRRGIERLHGHLSTTERIGVLPELLASLERDALRSRAKRGADDAIGASRTARSCATSIAGSAPCSRRARGPGAPTTCRTRGPTATRTSSWPTCASSRRACAPPRRASGRRPARHAGAQAEIFGFHLASLDLRQTQRAPRERARRGARPLRPRASVSAVAEDTRARVLTDEILRGRPFAPHLLDFSPETNETLELFRLVRRAHERVGPARSRPTSSA